MSFGWRTQLNMRPWLSWIERLATDQKVGGSNPSGRAEIFGFRLRVSWKRSSLFYLFLRVCRRVRMSPCGAMRLLCAKQTLCKQESTLLMPWIAWRFISLLWFIAGLAFEAQSAHICLQLLNFDFCVLPYNAKLYSMWSPKKQIAFHVPMAKHISLVALLPCFAS